MLMVVVMSPQLESIVMVINLILDKTKVISFSCLQLQTFHMCSSVIISVSIIIRPSCILKPGSL